MKNSSLRHPGVLNRYPGCVEIVDSQNQRLVFTVGPVWLSCDKMGNSVGVWVNYQERDRDSEYKGPHPRFPTRITAATAPLTGPLDGA